MHPNQGCVKLLIAAVQQFALNALLQNLAASAKWAWFGVEMMSEKCF